MNTFSISGIGASPGIAIGRAFILKKPEVAFTGGKLESPESIANEIEKFGKSIRDAVSELEAIQVAMDPNLNQVEIEILETQIQFLVDPQIESDVIDKIKSESKTAGDAVIEVINTAVQLFEKIEDDYLRARAADIKDTGNRILRHLNPVTRAEPEQYPESSIIIAGNISPSDTIAMDKKKVIGFATSLGGKTSHAAIVARTRGIPAVAGCGSILETIISGDEIVLDGTQGLILVNPDQAIIHVYRTRRIKFLLEQERLKSLQCIPSNTMDGVHVELFANISQVDDLELMFENGGTGVGLFRTELFFMEKNSFPDEEEQFSYYKQIAIKSKNVPVTIRTLDIGGDKQLPYFKIAHESNPFLGYRAIRISLDHKDIFSQQLKAILRASVYGKLKIMFPMISNIREIRQARTILLEAKEELIKRNLPFDSEIETGIMIEIPAAAASAGILAKEADFFSIGTNDLCQYTLAVDRMNEKVSSLYDHFNPGVLGLIKNTIDEAHKHNIRVGLCGEMASDPMATLLLLGMGLDEFSMSAVSIPVIKEIIVKSTADEAKKVCDQVMKLESPEEIKAYLETIKL